MTLNDEEITAAFARLDGALAPPMDGAQRIERRLVTRRRRRRAAAAGTLSLVAVATVGTVVLIGSGDDGSHDIAVDQPNAPSTPVSTLVMTRPDGSTYAFDDVTVSCEPPPGTEGATQGTAGRIWMTSPMPPDVASDDARLDRPFVYFEGVVAKLQGDRLLELPVTGPGDSSSRPLTLFVADPLGNRERANEVSSAGTGAVGTVRVLRATCTPAPALELEVDATLGSEVQQDTRDLAGTLR